MKTIFEIASEYYSQNGRFDYNFDLEEDGSNVRFVPGLADELYINFNQDKQLPNIDEVYMLIDKLANSINIDTFEETYNVLKDERYQLSIIDSDIKDYLKEKYKSANKDNFIFHINKLIFESYQSNFLKFGLILYDGLDIENETIDNAVFLFSKIGETSRYCLPIISKWKNANEMYKNIILESVEYAKCEAVEYFEPKNQEDRRWLLHNGTDQFLSYYQSATDLTEKCKIREMLKDKNLPQEDFDEIGRIIGSYFSEGPARDLHKIPWKQIMLEYIDIASTNITEGGLLGIKSILFYKDRMARIDLKDKKEIISAANQAWHSKKTREYVKEKIKNHEFFMVALEMGLSCGKYAYEAFEENPLKNSYYIRYFENSKKYIKKAVHKYKDFIDFSNKIINENNYSDDEISFIYFMLPILKEYPVEAENMVYAAYLSEIESIKSKAEGIIYYWGIRNMSLSNRISKVYNQIIKDKNKSFYYNALYGVDDIGKEELFKQMLVDLIEDENIDK